ncbi:MAG: hypothetical protein ACI959_000722 [Limisphaerales bacterium]|jgi:hypothetical protein
MYTPSPSDFKEGSIVKNRHTLVEGIVVGIYDFQTIEVEVDGDIIPMDVEDILMPGEELANPVYVEKEMATLDHKPTHGMHLLFVPSSDVEFDIWLSNNTSHTFLASLQKGQEPVDTIELKPGDSEWVEYFHIDELNDLPLLQFSCWRKLATGTDHHFRKTIKPKASVFMKKNAQLIALDHPYIEIFLFDELPPQAEKLKADFNPSITNKPSYSGSDSIRERINFSDEIDLHAEKLLKEPHKMEASQILSFQLRKAASYIDKAMMLGLSKVYLIHGKGKGRLRDDLHNMLRRHPNVVDFEHGYFPKYGHGATAVHLD